MRGNGWLSIFAVLLIASQIPSGSSAGEERVAYVALPPVVGVACPADAYTLLDGPGHSPPGPGPVGDPVGWLLGYEHECTMSDAQNAVREELGDEPRGTGYGAYGFRFDFEDIGSLATATPHDVATGADVPIIIEVRTLDRQDAAVEGCGQQSLVIPEEPEPDWYWGHYRFWVWVPSISVGEDLGVCFGTTGELHATWGAP